MQIESASNNSLQALQASETRYRRLFETAKDGILILDAKTGQIDDVNPYMIDMLHYSYEEFVGKKLWEVSPFKDTIFNRDAFEELQDKGYIRYEDLPLETKEGKPIAVEFVSNVYNANGGKVIQCNIRNITKHKQTEEALHESEVLYRTLFDGAKDGIALAETETGRLVNCNQSLCQMVERNKAELVGQGQSILHPPAEVIERFSQSFKKHQTGDSGLTLESRLLAKSGKLIPVEIRAARIRINDRDYLMGIFRDITERKQAEENLRESEESFRNYLEYAPDGVYTSDLEGNFLYGNLKCEEIIGYRREELIGKNLLELNILSENSLNKAAELLQENMEGKSTGPDEIELISKEGRLIPVEINTSVVQRRGQRIILACVRDITERKRAEKEIQTLARFPSENPNPVLRITRDGTLLYINQAGLSLLPELHLQVGQAASSMLRESAIQAIDNGSVRVLHLEHDQREFSFTVGPVVADGYANLYGDDVTERKQSEKELKETLENLRKAVNATIQVLVSAVEVRDPYTAGHQIRSADLARAIATEMGLSQKKIDGIRMAGTIHDIGKLSVPAEILSNPSKLSDLEFSLIKEHACRGFKMLKDVESPWPLAEIVYQHHERMDGSGYPRHLKGEDILIEARILGVADVVEAMASHRPYRPGLGIEAALEEIEKNKGILYDSTIADTCLRLFREKGFQLVEA